MKKFILCVGLLLAGLTSCTNNEVIDVPQEKNAIQFKAPFVGKNTRGTDAAIITTADVNHIHVFGKHIASDATDVASSTEVFNNTKLEKSNGYTSDVSWVANRLYSFAAYIDGTAGTDQGNNASFALVDITSSKLTISNYTVTGNDLVVAMPEDIRTTTTSNYPVPLAFTHTLSKVRFTFTNAESSRYNMDVSEIKIANAYNQGDLTVAKTASSVASAAWNLGNSHSKNGYEFTSVTDITPTVTDYTECFVIPQNIEQLSVTFKITLTDNQTSTTEDMEYTASLATGIVSWTPRYAYNYNLAISAHHIDPDLSDKIKFTLTVNPWIDQVDQNLAPTQIGNS